MAPLPVGIDKLQQVRNDVHNTLIGVLILSLVVTLFLLFCTVICIDNSKITGYWSLAMVGAFAAVLLFVLTLYYLRENIDGTLEVANAHANEGRIHRGKDVNSEQQATQEQQQKMIEQKKGDGERAAQAG